MNPPRVSVVVPTYGRPRQVRRAVDGLLACRIPPGGREILVVDDGSPIDVAAFLGKLPSAVRVVRQDNAGPASARNHGWQLAQGELIAFTDDDTEVSPDWLCELVDAIDARPAVAGVGGAILPMKRSFLADFVQLERFVDHAVDDDGSVRYLVTANVLFRRSALEVVDGFDTRYRSASEDVDLSLRLRELGWPLAVTDGAVVRHEHRSSLVELVRLSHRAGSGRALLAERHPSAMRVFGSAPVPLALLSRVRRYRRAGCAWPRVLAYLCLHLTMRVVMVVGMLRARAAGH